MQSIMMERLSFLTHHLSVINELIPADVRIYVFGSFLVNAFPNDIDIVIVYSPPHGPDTVNAFRWSLAKNLESTLNIYIDTCCLSRSEASENGFVSDEGCILVWPPLA